MFKNIFSNPLNRLVYRGGNAPDVQAVNVLKEDAATPESLREEAKQLGQAIDRAARQIETDVNELNSVAGRDHIKVDLNKPESFDALLDNRDLWSVLKSLSECQQALREGATRGNLDYVRVKMDAARAFYAGMKAAHPEGDPFALYNANLDVRRVPTAQPPAKKTPEDKEVAEKNRWTALAQLVDQYNKLGDTPNDQSKRSGIQRELQVLTSTAMRGKPDSFTMANLMVNGARWNLRVDRAKGPGTEAFRLTMQMPARTLEQGGRPGSRTVRYEDMVVYAGGSARDFEKKA